MEALPATAWRSIVEQSPDGVVCTDRSGCILVWNRGAERIFGFAASEAVGASLDLIIPERFRAAHWKAFEEAVRSGKTKNEEGRVLTTRSIRKDGGKLYVDFAFGLLRDDAGEVTGVLATARPAAKPPG